MLDQEHVAHGELLRQCAAAVAAFPQTVAIGVNCTHPTLIPALIAELRDASDKPIVVYPNSGEGWDAQAIAAGPASVTPRPTGASRGVVCCRRADHWRLLPHPPRAYPRGRPSWQSNCHR